MPKFIGLKKSNFRPEKITQIFMENEGEIDLTTESILEGWRKVETFLKDHLECLKNSHLYIQEKEGDKDI
jgi:hypothetical protein